MKKNWIVLLLLLFLGGLLFVACQDEFENPPIEEMDNDVGNMLNRITNPEIKKAIQWYGNHKPESPVSKGGTEDHPLFKMMMPRWTFAFIRKAEGNLTSVEVPLRAYSRVLFTLPENAIAYEETKNSMYIRSLTRLVVLTNNETGVTKGFFMTLVPTKKYMDARRFNVYRSTYFDRERDFDGYIYFHELDGSFANGWRYEDGKITHEVKKAESSVLSRGYQVITHCYPKYLQVCTGYWQPTENGGQEYVEANCYEEYVGEECYTETIWVPDPTPDPDPNPGTGGGTGGGGYNPDPSTPSEGTVDSDWWGPTHNNIIKRSLEDMLTPEQFEAVKAGSALADSKDNQETEDAYWHAMTIPGETREKTIEHMRGHFEKYATDFFERKTNYKDLGIALHMIMDAYSPAHNLKVWKNNTWYYIPHAFEAGFLHYRKVDKAEQAIAEVYADLISSDYSDAGEVFDAWINGHLGPLHPDNQK